MSYLTLQNVLPRFYLWEHCKGIQIYNGAAGIVQEFLDIFLEITGDHDRG